MLPAWTLAVRSPSLFLLLERRVAAASRDVTTPGQPGGVLVRQPTDQPLLPAYWAWAHRRQTAPARKSAWSALPHSLITSARPARIHRLRALSRWLCNQVALAHAAGLSSRLRRARSLQQRGRAKIRRQFLVQRSDRQHRKNTSHNHFELLSSYTWSHSIDDGTDLQSTLEPQDSSLPIFRARQLRQRPAPSLGHQRRLPDFSAQGMATHSCRHFLSNFTVAPLIEFLLAGPST